MMTKQKIIYKCFHSIGNRIIFFYFLYLTCHHYRDLQRLNDSNSISILTRRDATLGYLQISQSGLRRNIKRSIILNQNISTLAQNQFCAEWILLASAPFDWKVQVRYFVFISLYLKFLGYLNELRYFVMVFYVCEFCMTGQ